MSDGTRDTFFTGQYVCKHGQTKWWVKYPDCSTASSNFYSLTTYFDECCFVEEVLPHCEQQ